MSNATQSWWSLDLEDGILAFGACEQIKEEFRGVHAVAGHPATMAVFINRTEGDLHCHVHAYFAPACAQLAVQRSAVPCMRPDPASLELLIGDPTCWDVLFPTC